nr:olfactory receptor 10K2-like [Zonotrichia albicollis]
MDPRDHCDTVTVEPRGTKDIIVALLGCMVPRGQSKSAVRELAQLYLRVNQILPWINWITVMFAYLKPPSISSPSLDLALSVLYSVVPPALNPLIYSLRNHELKAAVCRLMTG